jgi:hypothetical protein
VFLVKKWGHRLVTYIFSERDCFCPQLKLKVFFCSNEAS